MLTSRVNSTPPCIKLGRKEASVKEKHGEKKEYTPFLPESKCALSMRGLAQLVDENSNKVFKEVDIFWAMGEW